MRRSLMSPIPEIELAAKLLDDAANALLANDKDLCASLLHEADMPCIMQYAKRIVGKISQEVHRQTHMPKDVVAKHMRDPARMPTAAIEYEIYSRDGWTCRFCDSKVISKKARAVFIKLFPEETRWHLPEFQKHSALYAMSSSLDHVVPHSRGGKNEIENFVTACYCCQFGRGQWTLEETELEDPRKRPPISGTWDGLTRLEQHFKRI